jgi:hypothetical protein
MSVDESSTDASTTPCASCSPEWTFIVYVDLYMFFSMSPVGAPVVYTQHDRKHATFMCLQLISTIADRVPTLHDLDNLGSSFQLLPDAGYLLGANGQTTGIKVCDLGKCLL